jgi:hypothetical protein
LFPTYNQGRTLEARSLSISSLRSVLLGPLPLPTPSSQSPLCLLRNSRWPPETQIRLYSSSYLTIEHKFYLWYSESLIFIIIMYRLEFTPNFYKMNFSNTISHNPLELLSKKH